MTRPCTTFCFLLQCLLDHLSSLFVYGPVRSLRRGLVELQRPVERLERVAQLGLSRLVQARVHPARLSPLAGLEAQEVADNLVSKVSAANPAAISDWA